MPTGTITRFFTSQGYGYITPDGNDGDYVVTLDECSDLRRSQLSEGLRVQFDEGDGTTGLKASNVVLLID